MLNAVRDGKCGCPFRARLVDHDLNQPSEPVLSRGWCPLLADPQCLTLQRIGVEVLESAEVVANGGPLARERFSRCRAQLGDLLFGANAWLVQRAGRSCMPLGRVRKLQLLVEVNMSRVAGRVWVCVDNVAIDGTGVCRVVCVGGHCMRRGGREKRATEMQS